MRAGVVQAWHEGEPDATPNGAPLRGFGPTLTFGLEYQHALSARFALRGALGFRIDLVGFQNGNSYFTNEGASLGGAFLELGGVFAL